MNTYTTRNEAIETEIIQPLGDYADQHDIDAIADEALGDYTEGYACKVDEAEFWAIVEKHAL